MAGQINCILAYPAELLVIALLGLTFFRLHQCKSLKLKELNLNKNKKNQIYTGSLYIYPETLV